MSKLSYLANAAVLALIGFANTTPAAALVNLAINAGGAATVKTLTALQYINNGVIKYKAALAAQTIAPTVGSAYAIPFGVNPATGLNYTAYFVFGLDSTGAVVVVQGSYKGQPLFVGQMGATAVGTGDIPDLPVGVTPFGILKVANGTAATPFVPGVTALDLPLVTATYFDVAVLPGGNL